LRAAAAVAKADFVILGAMIERLCLRVDRRDSPSRGGAMELLVDAGPYNEIGGLRSR
jgi:hypothetical protein